jgi:NAD-dependent deacetylase
MNDSLSLARHLLARATTVAAFSGAGLSAESGIATFRGKAPDAKWSQFNPMQLASPEGFAENPAQVIEWYNWRRQELAVATPNSGHRTLARFLDLVQITQNVDDLLERAGCPPEHVIHLHGSISRDRCHGECGHIEKIDLASPPSLHACPNCYQLMRPDVVWFGEPVPFEAWHQAQVICSRVNCLLVLGTSATVYPAAGLIQIASQAGAHIIVINPETSSASSLADVEINEPAGEILPILLQGLTLSSY